MKKSLYAILFVALSGLPARAQKPDGFEARQQAAVAQNPPGVHCVLRLAAGKTRFQQGETIRVTAEFTADTPNVYWMDVLILSRPVAFFEFGRFHAAPQEGVSDPLADYPLPKGGGFSGGIPNPVPLSDKPAELTVELNRWLRFDRPGHYRVYATMRNRVLKRSKPQISFAAEGLPVASDIVEFDIVPTNPAWAQVQLDAQKANLASDLMLFDPPRSDAPPQEGDVRWLNTPAAARPIIERMSRNETPHRIPDENVLAWQPALIGYPDRKWLIEEMRRALARPDCAVTQSFLETLALLVAMQREPCPAVLVKANADLPVDVAGLPPELAQADANWRRRSYQAKNAALASSWKIAAQSVDAKADQPRIHTLFSLLALGWGGLLPKEDEAIVVKLPGLSRQIAPLFDALPQNRSGPLEHLIRYEWPHLKADAPADVLLATLLRLWDKQTVPQWGPRYELSNDILRRIHELSPEQGRALILKEIANPRPCANGETLGILPDATLPELDDVLLANLQKTGADSETIMFLIERYASPKILPQLKVRYANDIGRTACFFQSALLAYFLRADPDYGVAQIERALAARKETGCYQVTLSDVAKLEMTPALERVAIAHLNDADEQVQRNAAQMLKDYGSPAARTLLHAAAPLHP